MLLSSYLDNWWSHNFKIYLQSSSKSVKKGGEDRNTKIWISGKQKEFFGWNKKRLGILKLQNWVMQNGITLQVTIC